MKNTKNRLWQSKNTLSILVNDKKRSILVKIAPEGPEKIT